MGCCLGLLVCFGTCCDLVVLFGEDACHPRCDFMVDDRFVVVAYDVDSEFLFWVLEMVIKWEERERTYDDVV